MSDEMKNKIDIALLNFYLEANKDIIDESLKENISDLDEYTKKKKQIIFLANALAKKKHNEYLLELVNKFQEAILLNIEKPISILKQLIQGNATPSLYKNLEKFSKEDIIEIIKDKNLVELIEQLEANEKNK